MIADTKPDDDPDRGIRCPKCGCGHVPVRYTRHLLRKTVRARECRHCGKRFNTYEQLPGQPPGPPAE